MSPIRLAVIGAGHLGRIHVRLAGRHEEAALVAVVEPCPRAARQIADQAGVPVVAALRDAPPFDAAIVAAPTPLHHEIVASLLDSGRHVLVEKPIASTVEQADALIDLAGRRGRVLQVGHVERFNPAWVAGTALPVQPRHMTAVRNTGYSYRSTDVSVVHDLMIHDIDLALSLAGSELQQVEATGAVVVGPEVDIALARLRWAGGCTADLTASRCAHAAERRMTIYGGQDCRVIDMAASAAEFVQPSEVQPLHVYRGENHTPEGREYLRSHFFREVLPVCRVEATGNAILDEQRDFLRAIRSGEPPRVTGRAGRDALAVAERILEAMQVFAWQTPDAPATVPLAPAAARHRRAG